MHDSDEEIGAAPQHRLQCDQAPLESAKPQPRSFTPWGESAVPADCQILGLYGAQIPGQLTLKPQWWFAGIAISILGALAAAAASLTKALRMPLLATAQPFAWQQAQRRWLTYQSALAPAAFGSPDHGPHVTPTVHPAATPRATSHVHEADHGNHSEAAWAARVEPALRFLFPGGA